MSKEIWNLGRVCGLSAYELYLRYIAINSPGTRPATEKEWLSSMLTMGNSMLLHIGKDYISGVHYRDIPLPSNCKICAANTIFASYFAGSGALASNSDTYTGFATRVTDYGPLISNTSESHPDGTTVPPTNTDTGDLTEEMKLQIPEYLKIIDGIVIQPGTWSESELKPPYCDFAPDLTSVPNIRISFKDAVNVPFFILLTGFSNKFVVQGMSGTDTATGSQSPEDGDFLGPWVFPWASKILFSVPPAFMEFAAANGYTRKLPSSATAITVVSNSLIDMESANPSVYYDSYYRDAGVSTDVTAINFTEASMSVFATYQASSASAPALYGLKVSAVSSAYKFYPIDTTAPGTIKMFSGSDAVTAAENIQSIPYNVGMYQDSDLVVYEIDTNVAVDSAYRHIPLSEDKTTDLAAWYMFNARDLWFYSDIGGVNPTAEVLQDIKVIRGTRVIRGHVSTEFINDFCVSYDTAIAACEPGKLSSSQRSYIDQLVAKYGETYVKQNYVFYFHTFTASLSAATTEGMFFPVNVNDRSMNFGTKLIATMNADHGFNFSGSPVSIGEQGEVSLPSSDLDYLGSLYNRASYGDPTATQYYSDGTTILFANHPVLSNVVKEYITQWYPYAAVPKPPVGYDDQFIQWFNNVKLISLVDANNEGADVLTAMGIHSDYHDLDLQTFMQYAATERDLSLPMSAITTATAPLVESTFFYNAAAINTIAAPDFSWESLSDPISASLHAIAKMSKLDFYRMAEIHLYIFSESGGTVTDTTDVTEEYTDKNYHTWSASGYSGLHQTSAVSLIDGAGAPLPTGGTAGTLDVDRITWDDLLNGLNQNKTIDLLGDVLRILKNSGGNYIQLANIQLYVSVSEPTGTIPEGSVGLGWGAGIFTYTSGAWVLNT